MTTETEEKPKQEDSIQERNLSPEVTERRIYDNLQIDGLKPSIAKVRELLKKLKGNSNGPGTKKSA